MPTCSVMLHNLHALQRDRMHQRCIKVASLKVRSEAYTMIIETRIDETVGGTVSKELDDQSRRGGGTATASIHGDNTVAAGGAVTRSKVKQSYESLSNTVRIKNTLVITARQRALTEEMALPAIEQRLERIIPESKRSI